MKNKPLTDLEAFNKWFNQVPYTISGSLPAYVLNAITTALQTRTPPVPVDTINIKREVLQEMRHWINKFYEHKDEFYLGEALATLDAVLEEGK